MPTIVTPNRPTTRPTPQLGDRGPERLRRGVERAEYDGDAIRSILAEGIVAHVGVGTDDGPIVLPMAYGLIDDRLYLHGAVANAMLRSGRSAEVCVTVTLLDGLILARNPFHNSMSYRSVVVRGEARLVEDADEHWAALEAISDHVVQRWADQVRPSDAQRQRTQVLAVPLAEASAKVRGFGPSDEPEDLDAPVWAGTIPARTVFDPAVTGDDVVASAREIPASVRGAVAARPAVVPGERPLSRFATLTFDALDPERLGEFWAALLRGRVVPGNDPPETLVDVPGTPTKLLFLPVSDPTEGKNRCHPDVHTADLDGEVARAVELGASILHRMQETSRWVVLADPEGNEFCIVDRPGPSWPQLEA